MRYTLTKTDVLFQYIVFFRDVTRSNLQTTSPVINQQYKTCEESSGWVCEHRWYAIRGMARFRQEVTGTGVDNEKYEQHRLAFGRGGKGYFALNNGYGVWSL